MKHEWTCSICKQPIADGSGYILVKDAKTGGYPQSASCDDELRMADPDYMVTCGGGLVPSYTLADIIAAECVPANIQFDATHAACDPKPDGMEYWFGNERASTLADWITWVHHLSKKNWMGKRDIVNMIEFWYANRGLNVYECGDTA